MQTSQIMPTYARLPVAFERGESIWLWDTEGRRYFDALSGIAVCGLGHAHPVIREALCQQAGLLLHTSNLYAVPNQERLAKELVCLSGMDNVFFCNSGAEANEAAIKIARKYGHAHGIEFPKVVVMENSFHGRTLATLSATGNRKVQEGFQPLVEGFLRVPYDDIEAVAQLQDGNIVAVMLEPIQGEGGIRIPAPDYLERMRTLCDERDWLLMLDEVQTGIGRTGRFLAYQYNDILPDVCTLAKGLGNGVPIGACLARGSAAQVLTAGKHGSTFGGNPLACSAALATLSCMQQDMLIEQAATLGAYLLIELRNALQDNSHVVTVRGKGLMLGIEMDRPCAELVGRALTKGLLINVTNETVIRLLPPLIMTHEQAQQLVMLLRELITEFTAS